MIFFYLALTKVIPATVGIIFLKRMSPAFRWIVAYVWFGLATELVMFALAKLHGANLSIAHFYHIGETWLIALFIIAALENKVVKQFTIVAAVGLTVLAILEMTVIGSLQKFDPITSVTEHATIITLLGAVLFHIAHIKTDRAAPGLIIIVFALLIYFISSITYFALLNLLPVRSLLSMAYVHAVVNVVCNITFAAGLWMARAPLADTMTYQQQAQQIGLMKELISVKDRLIEMLKR